MARKRKRTKEEDSSVENLSEDDEKELHTQTGEEVDEILSEIDSDVVIDEPDEDLLVREADGLSGITEDEPLDLLSPTLEAELSEDPVRLYLREIGEIELLSVDYEFWLAARIEAARRVDVINRDHPIARRGQYYSTSIYLATSDELGVAWRRLVEDTHRLGYDSPDLSFIRVEARTLRQTWESDTPSYLRAYLDNGRWGVDHLWDQVARNALTVFICFYLLPEETAKAVEIFTPKGTQCLR